MTRYSFLRRGLRSEHGSSVAQAAAVALVAAALIGVIITMSPRLSSATEHAFTCLVASLSGGGGACGGGGSAALGGSSQDSPPAPDDCNAWCQVSEFGKELLTNVLGFFETIIDVGKYALGDEETRAQYDELGRLFEEDPLGTTGLVLGSIVDPIIKDIETGHYGRATGAALGNIIGGKGTGTLGKLGKMGKIDDVARGVAKSGDEVADAAAMPNRFNRKAAGYVKPEMNDTNCTYCQKPLTKEPRLHDSLESDHIIALRKAWEGTGKNWTADEWKRFSNDAENLVASCKSCNSSKQAKVLFDEWAPPNMTPEAQAQLKQRIQSIIEKYKLDNP